MSRSPLSPVHVVGGGLAGSETAWQLARAGVPVVLHEMRPVRPTEAHVTAGLAELVCSNSFRSDDAETNAVGLLHEELRRLSSLVMRAADAHRVPAGSALAVDRVGFSDAVQTTLEAEPLIEIRREEIAGLPPADWDSVILATGPLTSPALASALRALTGEDSLAFFDAIAPIVSVDSIDRRAVFAASRYGRGGDQVEMLRHGFPAVRISEGAENYDRQHQDLRTENGVEYGDTIEGVDFNYLGQVARLNIVAMAALGNAPASPLGVTIEGAVKPDTTVKWQAVPGAAGYRVWWRSTTAPQWTHSRWAGDATEITLPGVVIDDFFFGVSSVSDDGYESPVVFPGPSGSFVSVGDPAAPAS